jgi:hypothetical protein
MRKHTTIGSTVAARRGELLPQNLGKQRQARAKCYRIVTESAGGHFVGINLGQYAVDEGEVDSVYIKPSTPERQPLLPTSP